MLDAKKRLSEFVKTEKVQKFFSFITGNKVENFFSFILFLSIMLSITKFKLLPRLLVEILWSFSICYLIIISSRKNMKFLDNNVNIERGIFDIVKSKIGDKVVNIIKGILMYFPFYIIEKVMLYFMIDTSANQKAIIEDIDNEKVSFFIMCVIIGPIIEELIFRLLPRKFIPNNVLYIIISSVIFASMHVVNDPNWSYYLWFYLPSSIGYTYAYYKTNDIFVPIFLHSLNNLIDTISILTNL